MILGLLVAAPVSAQTATNTATRTATVTATPVDTSTRTYTPTATRTVPPTRTAKSTNTATPVSTSTPVPPSTVTRTATSVPTATLTPILKEVNSGNAGCLVLTDTPALVGNKNKRLAFAYWSPTGTIWCGYNYPTLSKTPGPASGAMYTQNGGLVRCQAQDLPLYCLGTGQTVCWDEVILATPSATATTAPTNTPA